MRESLKLFASISVALAIAGCNAGGLGVPATIDQSASPTHQIPQWQARAPNPGPVRCSASF